MMLYLVCLLGFLIDDKMLKWVGLDYWEFVNVVYYDLLEEVFEKYFEVGFYFIIKFG